MKTKDGIHSIMRSAFLSWIGLIIFSVIISSCNIDDSNLVSQTADKIEGNYKLVSMYWDGDPIDINADGLSNKDILSEMMALPTNSQNTFQTSVIPMNYDRSVGVIGFQFPMQNVSISSDGRIPTSWMLGNTLHLNLSYEIGDDGILTFEHFDTLGLSEYDSRVEMKRINNGTATFDMNGKLMFSVNYTLYDHISGQLVASMLHYELEKL